MIEKLILLIIFVLLSAFFSASEMAYIVANNLKIEIRARKKNPAAVSAHYFKTHPQTFFSTILLGNNIVSIALASLSTIFLSIIFGWSELTILVVSSGVLLIFGELFPKYLARENADRVYLLASLPLRFVYIIFYPFVKAASLFSDKLTGTMSREADAVGKLFERENIKGLVKESEKAGIVDKKESDIIEKVIELGEQRVYEAMTPRTDIVAVEITQSISEVLSIFIESGYSKLPVYEDNQDNIKGILLSKDMFKKPDSIQSIMRNVSFIPETKKSLDVLNEFLGGKITIAIVVDEFGGTAGIVTMEDILEELFGEIIDEFDVDEHIFRKIAPNTYIISGKYEIDQINENSDLKIEEGDYETIGGYIISKLGRIPALGETVVIGRLTILIARATAQRIDVIKLIENPE